MNRVRTAATALMCVMPLVVAPGCGSNDADYVDYSQTATTDTETHAVTTPEPVSDQPSEPVTNHGSSKSTDLDSTNATADSSVPVATVSQADATFSSSTASSPVADQAAVESNAAEPEPPVVETTSPISGLTGPVDVPQIDTVVPEEPRPIELLVPNKRFRRERGTDAFRVSYDDIDLLKILNMDPVPPNARDYFPQWLNDLDGKQIRIRGFMYPVHVATGITSFTLARDNQICCFQRMPKVYDVILVKLAEGESTDYIDQRAFDVEGTFHIDATPDEIELPRLYRIDNARVLD